MGLIFREGEIKGFSSESKRNEGPSNFQTDWGDEKVAAYFIMNFLFHSSNVGRGRVHQRLGGGGLHVRLDLGAGTLRFWPLPPHQ